METYIHLVKGKEKVHFNFQCIKNDTKKKKEIKDSIMKLLFPKGVFTKTSSGRGTEGSSFKIRD